MGCFSILRRRRRSRSHSSKERSSTSTGDAPPPGRRRSTFTRSFTMARFGQPKQGLHALKRLVDASTLISPTQNGFHKPAVAPGAHPGLRLLLLSPAMEKHLRRVYDEMCGRDSQLSRAKLETFLRGTQGATGDLELQLDRERYKFEQFLEVWYFQYQDAVRPVRYADKDLTKPISNYFINSSHNTYLSGNQLYGVSSADAYRSVLKNDCRCIEIDVWNGDHSGSRTPARSKSPHDHRRHLSSSSIPAVAASIKDSVDEAIHRFSRSNHHSRNASTNQPGLTVPGARDSAASLDPNAVNERLGRQRSESGSGSRSRSRSTKRAPKDEPVVMHAVKVPGAGDWTLTAPVGFREVCRAVRETAFEKNPLPIIVSLEVHADPDQQEVMVDIMEDEWAGLLLNEPFMDCDPKFRQPRLQELERKILIKVKKAPGKATIPSGTQLSLPTVSSLEDDASGSEDERGMPSRKRKVAICDRLSDLAIYTHSEHYKSFEASAARHPAHIFSINETRILELHHTRTSQMFTHNRDYFMRAYPKPTRVDSSNLDPSLYWRKGVQMVAMNWQKWDEGMMLNDAMFDGEKGWVLKPRGYLTADGLTSQAEVVRGPHRILDLRITIFAGQHIPLPESSGGGATESSKSVNVTGVSGSSFRPYIKCELHVERHEAERGAAAVLEENGGRAREGQYKQKTTSRETDHPDWGKGGVTLNFKDIPKVVEELSFVRLKIEDESKFLPVGDSLAAWACIRLDRLQEGYRFINLRDAKGRPTEGRLLVKIEKAMR